MKLIGRAVLVAVALLFAAKVSVFALNPADLSATYGQIPVEYYKVCYDVDDSRWFDFSYPVDANKDANLYFESLITEDNTTKLFSVTASKRFPKYVQASFFGLASWGGGTSSFDSSMWVEVFGGKGGASVLLPFDQAYDPIVGGRYNWRNLQFFFQTNTSGHANPMYGLTYLDEGFYLDLAYQDESDVSFVRLSKDFQTSVGTITPEIRTRFDDEGEVGFAVTFVPK